MTSEQGENRLPNGRFRPGESGNPGGRPVGKGIGAALSAKLSEPGDDGRSLAERITEVLIGMALGGDVRAIALIFDRVEGKARQAIAVENQGPAWIEIRYVDDWRNDPGVKADGTGTTPDDWYADDFPPGVKVYGPGTSPADL